MCQVKIWLLEIMQDRFITQIANQPEVSYTAQENPSLSPIQLPKPIHRPNNTPSCPFNRPVQFNIPLSPIPPSPFSVKSNIPSIQIHSITPYIVLSNIYSQTQYIVQSNILCNPIHRPISKTLYNPIHRLVQYTVKLETSSCQTQCTVLSITSTYYTVQSNTQSNPIYEKPIIVLSNTESRPIHRSVQYRV